jgi:nitrile hydratase accessory protein
LSGPDLLAQLSEPGPLLSQDGKPIFAEPWQAEIVAVAAAMVTQGRFTAPRWSDALGAEIRAALASGAPDNAATYYQAVLAAVEGLVKETLLVSAEQLAARKAQWIRAYEHTPHGAPVELSAGDHH